MEKHIKLGALDGQKDINKLEGVQVRKVNMIKLLEEYGERLNKVFIVSSSED